MAKDKPKKQINDDGPSTSKSAIRETDDKQNGGIWQDSRFNQLLSDPRFRSLPKAQRKVKIDKRFESMFTDQKFKIKYTVDKYGRRVNQSNTEDLKKYYEIDSDAEEESDEDKAASKASESGESGEEEEVEEKDDEENIEEEQRKEEKAIVRENDEQETLGGQSDNDDLGSDGEKLSKPLRERLFDPHIDYARGEGRLMSDSSSDDDSSEDEEDPNVNIDHTWGELDADAERTDDSTYRLAVCNMDWDRIRAVDLIVLFSSFLPPGGSILSVKIFLSEFGKERMKVEEEKGPTELVGLGKEVNSQDSDHGEDSDNDSDEDIVKAEDSDADEGDSYHMEKLRKYQLNRLRYYYAVVECDSVATADKIYTECDGIEYESSATRVDLRFIPDDTTFDEDKPTDECSELPESNSYQPRLFTNTALHQAKVELTWDETAVERRELGDRLASGKMENIDDKELRKMVAYSSESESDFNDEVEIETETKVKETTPSITQDDKKPKKSKKEDYINKYKALLAEINEKEQQEKNKKFGIEISWNVNEKGNAEESNESSEEEEKPNSELTPIEKVLKKRSEKNRKRKVERKKNKLLAQGIDPETAGNDSDSEVPDGIDMNDPYFAEEFANGDFVDPKAKQREKLKKQKETKALMNEEAEKQAKELELLLEDDDDGQKGKQHFSLEKILKSEQDPKSKRKRRKLLRKSKAEIAAQNKPVEDNFKLNVDDDRFKSLYSSPLYNIDPTHSHFKKTKGMEDLINEKLKRRYGVGINGETDGTVPTEALEPDSKKPRKKLEQTLLVKSLKRKLQANNQK